MNTTGTMQPKHTEINSIGFKLLFCGHKIPEATTIKVPNSFLMKQDFRELEPWLGTVAGSELIFFNVHPYL